MRVFTGIIGATKEVVIKKVTSYRKGRICKYHGCQNVLSMYNEGKYCNVHQRLVDKDKPPTSSSPRKKKSSR